MPLRLGELGYMDHRGDMFLPCGRRSLTEGIHQRRVIPTAHGVQVETIRRPRFALEAFQQLR